jgi:hypothetical protein
MNVYADLGVSDADEMLVKAQLASTITEIIKLRKLTHFTPASGAAGGGTVRMRATVMAGYRAIVRYFAAERKKHGQQPGPSSGAFELPGLRVRQRKVCGGHDALGLGGGPCADDRSGHGGMPERPGDGCLAC